MPRYVRQHNGNIATEITALNRSGNKWGVRLMRDCRNILKYHSTDDSRLTTARAIVGEYRICTQYAMDVWATKDKWLKTPKVLRPKQLFMAPETLHATHCTVEAFIGKCGPRAHVAAP